MDNKEELTSHLQEFNKLLRQNGYSPVQWSSEQNIFGTLVRKMVEVSENMENEIDEPVNINSLEKLDKESQIVQYGLTIINEQALDSNYYNN